LISVSNLTKRYGRKLALDDVSFSIGKGGPVGLLGLNGAGKTTVMSILAGYLCPTGGGASIGGYDLARYPREAKRLIGYMPELPALYGDMRVDEYMNFICDLRKIGGKGRRAHIDEIYERTGTERISRRVIRNLSKGYTQRVAFAAALMGYPPALILDEPTSGLDPSQAAEMRSLVKTLSGECIIVISSHILPEIQEICDRAIILLNGRVAADLALDGPGLDDGRTRGYAFWAKGDPADIRDALSAAGIAAEPLLQPFGGQSALEEIFFDVIRRQGGGGRAADEM
jgi:ABC-2 type transport system ATP-binding protein